MEKANTQAAFDEFIKNNYITLSSRKMSKQIGKPRIFIYRRMKKMNLVRPHEIIMQEMSRTWIKPSAKKKEVQQLSLFA